MTNDLLARHIELNMSNYGPDDVDALNAWAIEAYDALETLKRERDEAVAKLEALAGEQTEGFYLACYKDGRSRGVMTWWRPDDAGYTPYLEQAGVYTAEQIAADQSYYDNAHTVPVPVSFIDGRDSRQVDVGLSKNGQIFWSAKNLRAAISTLTSR